MTNEEKILEVLFSIQKDVSELKSDVAGLKKDVAELKKDVVELKDRVTVLEDDVAALKKDSQFIKNVVVKMENEHGKKLDALREGYSVNAELVRRYDPRIFSLETKVEQLTLDVRFLKAAVQ